MKFIIDNALSPIFANELREAHHDVVHVRDKNMQAASDEEIFDLATREDRVVVTADTDFGTLLALKETAKPSIVIFRRTSRRRPGLQVELLLKYLSEIEESLNQGSVVIIEETRIRVRPLPMDGGASN